MMRYTKTITLICFVVLIIVLQFTRFDSKALVADPKSVVSSQEGVTITAPFAKPTPNTPKHTVAVQPNPSTPYRPKATFNNGFGQKRIPRSAFKFQGYKPTGGTLPYDPADFLFNRRMWRYVDNATCRETTPQPSDYDLSWQRRAPYAILLGAMKCGTHAVTASLWEHPQVARNAGFEMHFFDSKWALRNDKGIDQWQTRKYYARAFRKAIPDFPLENTNTSSTTMIAFESSPRYLLSSDRIPDMILCVTPWVKLIAIVRDPISRASSHYRFLDEGRRRDGRPMVDWETWIQDDIRLLTDAGVLNATSPEEEYLAWKTYQRRPNSYQILGRGLYVIQIEHYLVAMDRIVKPRSDLLILQSEAFRLNRQDEYNRLLAFLNLPPHRLRNLTDEHITTTTEQSAPMPESIRKQLQELYRPYNERLYKLLGWDKVWDY